MIGIADQRRRVEDCYIREVRSGVGFVEFYGIYYFDI